jgi:ATP-binding cassette subfamily B protein
MVRTGVSDLVLLRKLLRQARPFAWHIAVIFLLNLVSAGLVLLTPLPLAIAVDSVLGDKPLPDLLRALVPAATQNSSSLLLALTIGLLMAIALCRQLQSMAHWLLYTYTGEQMVLGFRAQLFSHVQRLSLAYHDAKGTTDSTYRIQYDTPAIQWLAIDGLLPLVTALCTVGGMIAITAHLDWQLAAVAIAVCPVLFLIARLYRTRLRRRWREVKELESSALSVVQESLGALRVVKAFGQEQHVQERFLHRARASVGARLRAAWGEASFDMLGGLTIALGTGAVLFLGVRHVQAGTLSLGSLLLVMGYVAQLYHPLQTLSKSIATLQSSLASAERVFALLEHLPDVAEKPDAKPLDRARGDIIFDHLIFAYEPGHRVLRDLHFEIPAGTRVGIAGKTGAGKSTLLNLLTRFYDPSSGRVLLDGIDLRDYRVADLRNQFSLVLQDPVLFSTSIAENIAFARPGAGDAAVVEAARAADAHDFITALPQGYDTLVGERGMRLSGGERQRISLARAFLKDAPILLLDEPTSSVDIQTEATILDALDRLMRGRTTFMIAHRLSTLRDCDLRLEIEHGRIATAVHH